MPELPEVETVKRVLTPLLEGRKITGVQVNHLAVIAYPQTSELDILCKNCVFKNVNRRGKFIIFVFENDDKIIVHLRMTGCLTVAPDEYEMPKHTHLVFELDNKTQLRFTDPRRFGRVWYIKSNETDSISGIQKLGLEPDDKALDADYLKSKLGKRRTTIKQCLLDQSVVAGIGNIYSDEILFAAKINPNRCACNLTAENWQTLAKVIPERLNFFVAKNEISAEDYLKGMGKDYRNTPFLQVYGREGKPCPVCGEILRKKTIGGRSSVYCEKCQFN